MGLKVNKPDRKKYVLKTKKDIDILFLCKQLEKSRLSKSDKSLVALIKSQLEKDWRKHLMKKLIELHKKY